MRSLTPPLARPCDASQVPSGRLPVRERLSLLGYGSDDIATMTAEEVLRILEGGVSHPMIPEDGVGNVPGGATPSVTQPVTPRRYTQVEQEQPPPRLLTVREAAIRVGCSEDTLRRAYTCRELRVARIGANRVRIDPADLQSWLSRGGRTRPARPERRNS